MNQPIGYITLALNGRPYAELAHNWAASIRSSHWGAKVAVVTNMGKQFDEYADAFDKVIHVPGQNANLLKCEIYKLSPWKRTVFVDADSLFLGTHHNLADFEEKLKDLDLCFPVLERFTMDHASKAPLSWVNLNELWGHYGLGNDAVYPAIDSSLFYFRKCRAASTFFKKVVEEYGNYPHLKPGHPVANFPDEVTFSTVAAQSGLWFGELNGLTCRAQGVTCNRTAALSHQWLSMPGIPSRGWQYFYNALARTFGPTVGRSFLFRKV